MYCLSELFYFIINHFAIVTHNLLTIVVKEKLPLFRNILKAMPRRNIPPPPFPCFLSHFLVVVLGLQGYFTNMNPIPPPFPAWILQLLALILTLQATMPATLMQQLFPGFQPVRNTGRDLYESIKKTQLLWYATGESIESFERMVRNISWEVGAPRSVSHQPLTNRRRRCLLDVYNRVLLVLVWLKCYPTYRALAAFFSVSKTTVFEEVYHIVPILFLEYRHLVSWPNLVQWANFLNTWPRYPNVVGAIDGTIHRIQRPSGILQREFYRGDKKCHFMSSQIIIDPNGMIVLIVSG